MSKSLSLLHELLAAKKSGTLSCFLAEYGSDPQSTTLLFEVCRRHTANFSFTDLFTIAESLPGPEASQVCDTIYRKEFKHPREINKHLSRLSTALRQKVLRHLPRKQTIRGQQALLLFLTLYGESNYSKREVETAVLGILDDANDNIVRRISVGFLRVLIAKYRLGMVGQIGIDLLIRVADDDRTTDNAAVVFCENLNFIYPNHRLEILDGLKANSSMAIEDIEAIHNETQWMIDGGSVPPDHSP